eukprot:6210509-Pleurochrysis_carterae.AAC.3
MSKLARSDAYGDYQARRPSRVPRGRERRHAAAHWRVQADMRAPTHATRSCTHAMHRYERARPRTPRIIT